MGRSVLNCRAKVVTDRRLHVRSAPPREYKNYMGQVVHSVVRPMARDHASING